MVLTKANLTCKKWTVFRDIFGVKYYYEELNKCVRKFLSFVTTMWDTFPARYEQNKKKKDNGKIHH